jgi:hypothetical protein
VRAVVHPVQIARIVFAVLLACIHFLTPATRTQDVGVSDAQNVVGTSSSCEEQQCPPRHSYRPLFTTKSIF